MRSPVPVPAAVVGLLLSVAVSRAPLLAQSHAAASPAGKADHATPHWTYVGSEGPHAWGRIDPSWRACAVGREQSPIDLGGAIASKRANSPWM